MDPEEIKEDLVEKDIDTPVMETAKNLKEEWPVVTTEIQNEKKQTTGEFKIKLPMPPHQEKSEPIQREEQMTTVKEKLVIRRPVDIVVSRVVTRRMSKMREEKGKQRQVTEIDLKQYNQERVIPDKQMSAFCAKLGSEVHQQAKREREQVQIDKQERVQSQDEEQYGHNDHYMESIIEKSTPRASNLENVNKNGYWQQDNNNPQRENIVNGSGARRVGYSYGNRKFKEDYVERYATNQRRQNRKFIRRDEEFLKKRDFEDAIGEREKGHKVRGEMLRYRKERSGRSEDLSEGKWRGKPEWNEEPLMSVEGKNINMNIKVDISMKGQSGAEEERVIRNNELSPRVEVEINGGREWGGRDKRMETFFLKSELNSERDIPKDNYLKEMSQQEPGEKDYVYYLEYKANMGRYLRFEEGIEEVIKPQICQQRLQFLSRRGGVDKNYWLNYYCSLIRKHNYLNQSDIVKGRLNCLSFSLKEYNSNYNHKIHRPIFNMGKAIYRGTRNNIEMQEGQMHQRCVKEYNNNQYGQPNPEMNYYPHPRMAMYRNRDNINTIRQDSPQQGMNNQIDNEAEKYSIDSEHDVHQQQQLAGPEHINRQREEWSNQQQQHDEQNDNQVLEIVTMNNCIRNKVKEDEEIEKEEQQMPIEDPTDKDKSAKKKRKKYQNRKKKKSKEFSEVDEGSVAVSKKEPEVVISKKKGLKKVKIKPHLERQQEHKMNGEDEMLEEPTDESDSRNWIEYFSQVKYSQLNRKSRAYQKISKYFAFDLTEVLEMQEKFADDLFQKNDIETECNLINLNKISPFSKYFNPKEKSVNFAKEKKKDEESNIQLDSAAIRKIGKFRKFVKTHLGIVTSVNVMNAFLEKQADEEIIKELISKKDEGTRSLIIHLKTKRNN